MSLKFTILGCGSSMGVPRPDGYFGKCNPNNRTNYRIKWKRWDVEAHVAHAPSLNNDRNACVGNDWNRIKIID